MANILFIGQMIGELLDLVGILVIATGAIVSVLIVIYDLFQTQRPVNLYKTFRHNLGRAMLLGLEFLVAGDIIRSTTGTPDLNTVVVLVVLVLIRTFLGMTFEMEIEGRWPWQRARS